jgi:hypothetical protein
MTRHITVWWGLLLLITWPSAACLGAAPAESRTPSIGLMIEAVSGEDLEDFQQETGLRGCVRVVQVTPGSVAAKAGIAKGDILLAFGDKPAESPRAVQDALTGVAGKVTVLGMRPVGDGEFQPLTVVLTLPAAPSATQEAPPPKPAPQSTGTPKAAPKKGGTPPPKPAGKMAAPPARGATPGWYRDPAGRFRVEYPRGWTFEAFPNGQGAVFMRGQASASVLLFPGENAAPDRRGALIEQLRAPWKEYRESARSETKVAGQAAQRVEFTGVSPRGIRARAQLTVFVAGPLGFAVMVSAPDKEFVAAQTVWEGALKTFEVGGAPPIRTEGKTYQHPIGFTFWYPATWTVKVQNEILQLVPPDPGSSPDGPTEAYVIFGESVAGENIERPDDPRVVDFLDQQLRTLSPTLKRTGESSTVAMGKGMGAVLDWDGTSPKGDPIRARAFVSIIQSFGVALVGIGLKERVEARDAELRRMFSTFGFGEGQKDPRLVGVWLYEKNFSSGTFGSTTVRTMRLQADGTFSQGGQTFAGMQHTDSGGNVTGSTSVDSAKNQERGRWAAGGGKLFLWFDDGSYSELGYYIEDQSDGRVMLIQTSGGDKQLWTFKGA